MTARLVTTSATALKIRMLPQGADTGNRLLQGAVASAHGESFDHEWQFITTSSFAGWASAQYLETYEPPVAAPAAPQPAAPAGIHVVLDGEDPELTEAIEKLRLLARAEGIEFKNADYGGVRTEADTVRILQYRDDDYAVYLRNLARDHPGQVPVPKTTWRPINPFGTSMHNFGAARDVEIIAKPISFSSGEAMRRVGATAIAHCGLRWGGNFHRVDTPHLELAISLEEAKARWEARQ